MIKLLAVDLDGTLLNREHRISKGNLEAISKAEETGLQVMIATGRTYLDVLAVLQEAGTSFSPWIISANGAAIHRPTGEKIHSVPISKEKAEPILKWLEENEYYYEVFSETHLLCPSGGRGWLAIEADRVLSANPDMTEEEVEHALMVQYSQTGFKFVESYQEIINIDSDLYNLLVFSLDDHKLQVAREKFGQTEGMTCVSSAKQNFELQHQSAAKGIALERVARELGLTLEETAAVGDNYNDLSMLTKVSFSAAMGNAEEAIKQQCDIVTLTNDQDGVAYFIEKILAKNLL